MGKNFYVRVPWPTTFDVCTMGVRKQSALVYWTEIQIDGVTYVNMGPFTSFSRAAREGESLRERLNAELRARGAPGMQVIPLQRGGIS